MTQSLSSASYLDRHLGPNQEEREAMLRRIGYSSLDALIDAAVPAGIRDVEQISLEPIRKNHRYISIRRKNLKSI